jgi:hypothetical protein
VWCFPHVTVGIHMHSGILGRGHLGRRPTNLAYGAPAAGESRRVRWSGGRRIAARPTRNRSESDGAIAAASPPAAADDMDGAREEDDAREEAAHEGRGGGA